MKTATLINIDPKKDKLLVKMNVLLKPDVLQHLYEDIMAQYKTGVVILPAYADALVIPKETDIEFCTREKNDETN